jgi:hypothetical protein
VPAALVAIEKPVELSVDAATAVVGFRPRQVTAPSAFPPSSNGAQEFTAPTNGTVALPTMRVEVTFVVPVCRQPARCSLALLVSAAPPVALRGGLNVTDPVTLLHVT